MSRQFLDAIFRAADVNFNPVPGALCYHYLAGTTTPVTTYSDAAMAVPHAWPVVALSDGTWPQIYLADGFYKIVIKTAAGVTLYTVDNVQQFPANIPSYATRAAFQAAYIPASVTHFTVAGLDYVVDASGTAITSANGVKGSPYWAILPAHFGDVSLSSTTNMSTILQAAITYACSLTDANTGFLITKGPGRVDLNGRLYALSAGLTVNRGIIIENGSMVALSGFTGTYMIDIVAGAENARLQDLYLDGGLSGTTRYADLIRVNADRVRIENVYGVHFPNYGLYVFSSQEIRVTNCVFREWMYTDVGTADGTLRTAKAIAAEDADGIYSNCVAAQSKYPLYVKGALNLFIGCHFYNGGSTVPHDSDVVRILPYSSNNNFSGCYFDNGSFTIERTDSQDISVTITGCQFQRSGAGTNLQFISYVTSQTNEAMLGLSVVGCKFNSGSPSFPYILATGAGTYVAEELRKFVWVGNTRSNGGVAGWISKHGPHAHITDETNWYLQQTEKSLHLGVDSANTGTLAKRNVVLEYGGLEAHLFQEDFISFGTGAVTGGGPALAIGMFSDDIAIRPHDGAGGTDPNNGIKWDAANQAWNILSKFMASGIPTSSAGLPAGAIWCDTGAGNVLKRV